MRKKLKREIPFEFSLEEAEVVKNGESDFVDIDVIGTQQIGYDGETTIMLYGFWEAKISDRSNFYSIDDFSKATQKEIEDMIRHHVQGEIAYGCHYETGADHSE